MTLSYRLLTLCWAALVTVPVLAQQSDTTFSLASEEANFFLSIADGKLSIDSIRREGTGTLITEERRPLFGWPRELGGVKTSLSRTEVAATAYHPARTQVEVISTAGRARLRRVFEIFPGTVALRCTHYFAGDWPLVLRRDQEISTGVERPSTAGAIDQNSFRLALPGYHWRMNTVRFTDQTDGNNNLVQTDEFLLFNGEQRATGNVLIASDAIHDRQLWLLKEAPLGDSQINFVGYDFAFRFGELRTVGWGMGEVSSSKDEWTRGYGWALGLSQKGETAALTDLHRYQLGTHRWQKERDHMIMMNTWGDRGRDGKVTEGFVLRELEAAHQLGVTHFQIDDGWQKGLSRNSSNQDGQLWTAWQTEDWQPHPDRFPRGLTPVVDRARELGMELGLWFNASSENDYAQWERDARILTGLFRDHGIRYFKMDGLSIPTKLAEVRLRKLFEYVREASGGRVIFNLDVTAGRRGGYFHLSEYGNVFLENRYTDWGKYYPHWTLRNLWQLAHYVPPAKLQIEFLNKWRNRDKYPEDDPLAPWHYDFSYVFATAAVAQPLAWMEGTGLPDSVLTPDSPTARLIRQYRQIMPAMHEGVTLPIGDEPNGFSWTGFQTAVNEREGFLLVFRERHPKAKYRLRTRFRAGTRVLLLPHTADPKDEVPVLIVDEEGRLPISLASELSFGFYRYRIWP